MSEGGDKADRLTGKTKLILNRQAAQVKLERTSSSHSGRPQRKGRSLRQAFRRAWDFSWTVEMGLHETQRKEKEASQAEQTA